MVCCNHSERLADMMPLRGKVRALDLLPRLTESMTKARHPSSRRRGVCDGISGTTRVCLCLGCCLLRVCLCVSACCSGLNNFVQTRLGVGALGESGKNDQLLQLALFLSVVLTGEGWICYWVRGGRVVSP